MSRILKTFVNFQSSQSLLLLLAIAQAAQAATEHASVLWLLLFILITYIWWKSYGTCVYQQLASGLAQYRNGSHSAGISTPIWPQQCHLSSCKCVTLSWVWVKYGSIAHSSQTTLWFSILAGAIVECKYYTNVLGQLTANMNNDVRSKTACNQLA